MVKKRKRGLGSEFIEAQSHGEIRVGMLFLHISADELQFEELASAKSEFRWLEPQQYCRHHGGVRLVPGVSTELSSYANANRLHPLGVVIMDEHGKRTDILIRSSITSENSEAAMVLLHQHADFWCIDRQHRT